MSFTRLIAASSGAVLLVTACGSNEPQPGVDGGQGAALRCTPGDTRSCEGAQACQSEATQTCFATGEGWSTCACRRPSVGGSGGGGSSVGAGGTDNSGGVAGTLGSGAAGPSTGDAGGAAGACEDCDACGNGALDEGESCDDAGESPECNEDCTHAECGDGVVNASAGERCEASLDQACDEDCQWGPLHYLVHRYSFEGSGTGLIDAVGSATGEIVNTTLSGTGVLELSGGKDQLVLLPQGLVSGLGNATFEVWVSWAGGDPWQRLFDFGSKSEQGGQVGETWLMLTPLSGSSEVLRADFAVNGWGSETADATRPLEVGVQSHVVVVVDDDNDLLQLYLNGILESEAGFAGSLSMLEDVNNMIGGSQFRADPGLRGSLDEFRIYDVALPPEWIQDNFEAGPNPETRL